ncbi:MAG: hypothetical protein ACFFAS_18705 [Promethearchaeota archaeon]
MAGERYYTRPYFIALVIVPCGGNPTENYKYRILEKQEGKYFTLDYVSIPVS